MLSMHDKRGRFTLYSDTSKHATGSALYQVQDGMPRLIAYVSKRMADAAKNYSITELEMWSSHKYSKFCSFFEESRF